MREMEAELQQLLEGIAQGDETAFQAVYEKWTGIIYKFAWQMTGSKSMAEDITQDLFLMIIRSKIRFDPAKGSFSSFLYGVARNLAMKSIRKQHRLFGMLRLFESQNPQRKVQDPLLQMTREESAENLRRCILSLPPQYREAIVLCDLHELSYAEAAEITRSAIGTIRSRLHRGRELLIQKMRPVQETSEEKQEGGTPYEIPAL
jgi:RNA polymerase sigma-70 factor (ECF subfamily)